MSQQLINRSPDLKKLCDDGYQLEIRSGYLLTKGIPYLNNEGEIRRGTLVSELTLAGDVTDRPGTHMMYFAGEYPCKIGGALIHEIAHSSGEQRLAEGVVVHHTFSSKPAHGYYVDYHEKVTTYEKILSSPAHAVDSSVTARTFAPPIEPEPGESVFNYLDTASSRAGINAATEKLRVGPIAIVGGGGTGSYVLDLTAKCPVPHIHLFDGDVLLTHNAFRVPTAPSLEELRTRPKKAI